MEIYLIVRLSDHAVVTLFASHSDAYDFSAQYNRRHKKDIVMVVKRTLWYGQPMDPDFNI